MKMKRLIQAIAQNLRDYIGKLEITKIKEASSKLVIAQG